MRRISPFFLLLVVATSAGAVCAAVGTGALLVAGIVVLVLGGWAVSLCLHEFAHAVVAYRSGDLAIRARGYLTLDIRRYTNVALTFVLPVLFLLLGGIPLPGGAVWINHHSLRSKAVDTMVSLAGPLSNLVLGGLLIVSIEVFEPDVALAGALSFLALLQIFAFVLNILPIPGLDGWGAIEPYLSPEAQRFGAKARPWAPLILFVAIIGLPGVADVFFDISNTVFGAVGGNENLSAIGNLAFFFWR